MRHLYCTESEYWSAKTLEEAEQMRIETCGPSPDWESDPMQLVDDTRLFPIHYTPQGQVWDESDGTCALSECSIRMLTAAQVANEFGSGLIFSTEA